MLLHDTCLPTELVKPVNQNIIAATLHDCNDVPLTPGTMIAKCSDIPGPTPVTAGANVTVTGAGTTASPYVVAAAAAPAATPPPAATAAVAGVSALAVQSEYTPAKNTDDVEATTPAYVRAAIEDKFVEVGRTYENFNGPTFYPAGYVDLSPILSFSIPARPYARKFVMTGSSRMYTEQPMAIPTLGFYSEALTDIAAPGTFAPLYDGTFMGTLNSIAANVNNDTASESTTKYEVFTVPANTAKTVQVRTSTSFYRDTQQVAGKVMDVLCWWKVQEV